MQGRFKDVNIPCKINVRNYIKYTYRGSLGYGKFYYLSTLFPGQFEDKLPKGNELTELAGNFSQIDMEVSLLGFSL